MKQVILFLTFATFLSSLAEEKKEWCGTQEALRRFKAGIKLARPSLSGPVSYIERTNFRVHYTTSGNDATTPAYAESVAKFIEYSWKKQIDTLGWITPPPDFGYGGDDRYDIYIQGLSGGVMGYCAPEFYYTNPYPDGATSFIGLDNDMSYRDLRVVCAHEFNHASQNRYSYLEQNWWQENCATWMEDVCYDNINQYVDYFSWSIDPLDSPHKPITCEDDLYEYAGSLWPMFLHERYDISCPKRAWEKLGEVSGENTLSGIDYTLANHFSSNLTTALKIYGIWRYFTGTRADPTYHFSESNLWPTSTVLRSHSSYPASGNQGSSNPSGPGGTDYIQFFPGANYLRMSFDGQDNYSWSAYAIGYKTPPSDTYGFTISYPSGYGVRTVPFSGHSHIALVVTVAQWQGSANNLTFTYNCSLKTVYTRDVGVAQILSPPDRVKKDSTFRPKIRVENYGQTTVSFPVWFIITKTPSETIYQQTANVNNLPPDGSQEVEFSQTSIATTGIYSVAAWTALSGDEYAANDRLTRNLEVYIPLTGWERVADVPNSPDGKSVKSGGCLTVANDTMIFILKGNNTPSLYRFNPITLGIGFVGSFSYGGEPVKLKKGAFIIAGGDYIYLARGGNTNFFYRAPKASPMSLSPLSPIPGGPLKGGTGMVFASKGGNDYIYLLKGSKTRDFYAYDVTTGSWTVKPAAPAYTKPDRGYQIGSAITFDGDRTIYCLRAKYNEFYKYDIIGDTWVSGILKILPYVHPQVARNKYVKEGGALTFANNKVYAFKGGNTNEFWSYDPAINNWTPCQLLPSGEEAKGIKGGGSLVSLNGNIYALKGNNTTGIWRYCEATDLASKEKEIKEMQVSVGTPPQSALYGLRNDVKIYNPSGRLIASGKRIESLNKLPTGVYIIETRANDKREVKKLIIIE